MKYHTRWIFILLMVVTSVSVATAEVVEVDWKVSGDEKILRDTSSGMEWLDHTETVGLTYEQVLLQLDTAGIYEGFKFATMDEVHILWNEVGITDTNFEWMDLGEWDTVSDFLIKFGRSGLFDDTAIGVHTLGIVEGGPTLADSERWMMEVSARNDGVQTRVSSNHYIASPGVTPNYPSEHYSSYLVRYDSPAISGFWPANGAPGEIVFVFGSGFVKDSTTVSVNNINAPVTQAVGPNLLLFLLPVGETTGQMQVATQFGTGASGANFGDTLAGTSVSGHWPAMPEPGDTLFLFGNELSGVDIQVNGAQNSLNQIVTPTLMLTLIPVNTVPPVCVDVLQSGDIIYQTCVTGLQ